MSQPRLPRLPLRSRIGHRGKRRVAHGRRGAPRLNGPSASSGRTHGIAWLVALGGLHALQSAFGGTYSDDFNLPGTQSNTGAELLRAHDPAAGGTGAQVVLHDAG